MKKDERLIARVNNVIDLDDSDNFLIISNSEMKIENNNIRISKSNEKYSLLPVPTICAPNEIKLYLDKMKIYGLSIPIELLTSDHPFIVKISGSINISDKPHYRCSTKKYLKIEKEIQDEMMERNKRKRTAINEVSLVEYNKDKKIVSSNFFKGSIYYNLLPNEERKRITKCAFIKHDRWVCFNLDINIVKEFLLLN